MAILGLIEGLDAKVLSEAGWGVIFAQNDHASTDNLRAALAPLLALRREQAGGSYADGGCYREFTGTDAYKDGETKVDFIHRHGGAPGAVDPAKGIPYYLLIVGDPQQIPYHFQYQLDVQYAVGRLHFDTLEDYARYAESVVQAERGTMALTRSAAFFGARNPDDRATAISADKLITPLAEYVQRNHPTWSVNTVLAEAATKNRLAHLLGGNETPALLFSASHGMEGYAHDDPRLFAHQGALLCQDWPGPREHRGAIPQDYYFAGDDLSENAPLLGTIAFFFACFGGGTPHMDDFYRDMYGNVNPKQLAPRPFVAGLPRRMLAHPNGGALAAVGHVDRAWSYSFSWDGQKEQLAVFESTIKRLLEGHTIGAAIEFFNERYAEIASDLSIRLDQINYFGKKEPPIKISALWVANSDSRNYVVIGDPAVRLPVAKDNTPTTERATIGEVRLTPPTSTSSTPTPAESTSTIVARITEQIDTMGNGLKSVAKQVAAATPAESTSTIVARIATQLATMRAGLERIEADMRLLQNTLPPDTPDTPDTHG